MAEFTEVAPGCWVASYPWFPLSVTVIAGSRGAVVVDTHASDRAAAEVIEDVRRLGVGEVLALVNTHEHFDHTFGNGAFRAAFGPVPIHAHEVAAERTVAAGERIKEVYAASDDPHAEEVIATGIVPADHTFSSARVLDLGDRVVELIHPGRGHTAGDLVVSVPDARFLVAGDLVEESGPPAYGADCYPMDWPLTLDIMIGLLPPDGVVVPGHGAVVDRGFLERQRAEVGIVAETIRDLAGRGVPADEALGAADWPFPSEGLGNAVIRGYEQLPRSQKRLPLL